jgi:GTP-binding protein
MASDNFVDYVKIHCTSGKGGGGSTHYRREKYIPLGGPDGGDGGRGGHIILRGNSQLWTLIHLKYKKHIKAGHGVHGTGQLKTGAEGQDQYIEVPIGTLARDLESDEILGEITEDGQEIIIVPGGRGGRGNNHFKTSTNRAPQFAQPGEDGLEAWTVLELKILADVGLVGFPNAGKSTLLSVISAAKPEIGDYAFTTLRPNLGIVPYRDYRSFIMADIPGIIEGAHEGKGLGLRFLRHIERNSILLFMVPADSKNVREEYEILLNELKQFNPELLVKDRLLAITKSDMLDDVMKEQMKADLPAIPYIFISSLAQQGLMELKDMIWQKLTEDGDA